MKKLIYELANIKLAVLINKYRVVVYVNPERGEEIGLPHSTIPSPIPIIRLHRFVIDSRKSISQFPINFQKWMSRFAFIENHEYHKLSTAVKEFRELHKDAYVTSVSTGKDMLGNHIETGDVVIYPSIDNIDGSVLKAGIVVLINNLGTVSIDPLSCHGVIKSVQISHENVLKKL